jgi:DNA-binding Lrp family transcriptional regulator
MEGDYRKTLTEISGELGISRATVKRRIDSLFRSGRFSGYSLELDRIALGLGRLVYIEVKTNPREDWLLGAMESMDQCIQSDGVIGDYGLVFKMAFRDGDDLAERLHHLDEMIASTEAKRYRIIDILETYKERGLVTRKPARASLDDLDRNLLRVLIDQKSPSPISLWRLSRLVQKETGKMVSKSTVQKRIKSMVDNGVIRQFTIDPRTWSRTGVRAFVRFRTDPGKTRRIAEEVLARMREVVSLYRTGEDHALFSDVFVSDLSGLDAFLKQVFGIEGITDTVTTIVIERRKEARVPVSVLSGSRG